MISSAIWNKQARVNFSKTNKSARARRNYKPSVGSGIKFKMITVEVINTMNSLVAKIDKSSLIDDWTTQEL